MYLCQRCVLANWNNFHWITCENSMQGNVSISLFSAILVRPPPAWKMGQCMYLPKNDSLISLLMVSTASHLQSQKYCCSITSRRPNGNRERSDERKGQDSNRENRFPRENESEDGWKVEIDGIKGWLWLAVATRRGSVERDFSGRGTVKCRKLYISSYTIGYVCGWRINGNDLRELKNKESGFLLSRSLSCREEWNSIKIISSRSG